MYKLSHFLLAILLAFSIAAVAIPLSKVYAVNVTGNSGEPCNNSDATSTPAFCGDTNVSGNPLFGPNGLVTLIVRILSIIVGFLAVIFIVVEAIRFAVSGGDAENAAEAKRGLTYALIGLIVAALAQTLVAFVLNKVG